MVKKIILSILFIVSLILTKSYSQNVWTQKSNFGGTARFFGFGFSIGQKGYIGAGYFGVNYLSDVWEYDPLTDIWTQKASIVPGRGASVSFVIENKGYVCMGISSVFHNDLLEYDPALNTWTEKANLPAVGRYGGLAFSINGNGYVGGGNPGNGTNPCLNDFYEYNPVNNSWMQKTNFPGNPRYGMAGFSLGTKGYAGLGLNESAGVVFYQDFYEYEPNTDTWTLKANFPGLGRNYPTCFTIGNEGYLCGGENVVALADFYQYEPVSDSWTQLINYGGGIRWAASGFAIGNKGFAGTGSDFTIYYNDFWEYSPVSGISDASVSSGISVYGNLTNGNIEINFSENFSSPIQFEVYSTEGRKVFTKSITTTQKKVKIDLHQFSNGVYFYLIHGNEKRIKTGKIILL